MLSTNVVLAVLWLFPGCVFFDISVCGLFVHVGAVILRGRWYMAYGPGLWDHDQHLAVESVAPVPKRGRRADLLYEIAWQLSESRGSAFVSRERPCVLTGRLRCVSMASGTSIVSPAQRVMCG